MTKEAKILTAIGVVTLVFVIGVALVMGENTSSSVEQNAKQLVRSDSYKIGSESARVKIVEFGDYQCPACKAAHPILKKLIEQKGDQIELVFRNFPLPMHQHALVAAQAAEAAGEQGKYWEMNSKLYENQSQWEQKSNALEIFTSYAQELGLDVEKFKESVQSNKFAAKIKQDQVDGTSLGVNATPTFYINGQKFTGSLATLEQTINSQLEK